MKIVYLALGTNLGDTEAHLRTALDRIAVCGVTITKVSSAYETKPMYRDKQPHFLNMVLEGQTDVLPRVLLKRLLAVEKAMGRRRTIANGPRVIDIDILFYGRFAIELPELVIPHPRIGERRFVLEPMVEIAPEWRHPGTKKKMREMLEELNDQGVRKLGPIVDRPPATP